MRTSHPCKHSQHMHVYTTAQPCAYDLPARTPCTAFSKSLRNCFGLSVTSASRSRFIASAPAFSVALEACSGLKSMSATSVTWYLCTVKFGTKSQHDASSRNRCLTLVTLPLSSLWGISSGPAKMTCAHSSAKLLKPGLQNEIGYCHDH